MTEAEPPKPKLTLNLGLDKDKLKAVQDRLKAKVSKLAVVKKEKMPREEYKEILDLVRRKFSKAFPKSADPAKMLKLGIHIDLAKKLEMEEERIKRFLYVYTKKKKYILAMKEGQPRYDLKGNIEGMVLKEEVLSLGKKEK